MNNEQNLLDMLTRKGMLINVCIHYWRACKKLTADDLGLPANEQAMRLISLGHKKLLPRDALQPFALIEGRAHAAVEKASFAFLGGIARFLPNECIAQVMPQLKALEIEFLHAKESFLNDYGKLREESLLEWRTAAAGLSANPDQLVDTIAASFPSADAVERRFCFQTHIYQLAIPEGMRVELADYTEQQAIMNARQAAAKQAGTQIREQVDLFIRDSVATLREQTAKLCEEMLQSMNNSPKLVHQKTLNRLANFIDEFKQLNFANDQELEQVLKDARKKLLTRSADDYRNDRYAHDQLVRGLEGLAGKAREMIQQDTREIVQRFGQLGQRKLSLAA